MSALAGTRPLLALALKRERVRIPVYVVLFVKELWHLSPTPSISASSRSCWLCSA